MASGTTPKQFDGEVASQPRDPSLAFSGREGEFIAALTARVPVRESPDGPGDDAARLAPGDCRVVSTDALVEGVHFTRAHPPHWLGWKVLAVNLSDLAAMGATPEAFTLAAALPADVPNGWWLSFSDGMGQYARKHNVHLVGGDVVSSPRTAMFSVTCWGRLEGTTGLLRTGARPGHLLWIAGSLGRSRQGLARWLSLEHHDLWSTPQHRAVWHDDPLLRAHLRPDPPLSVGPAAMIAGAKAAMDISDGLWLDAQRMARASGVDLVFDLGRLPTDELLSDISPEERVLGGEDYALLLAGPPGSGPALEALGCSPIGHVVTAASEGDIVLVREGLPIDGNIGACYQHFSGASDSDSQ